MDRWAGKVALVTGASSGIGAAVAVRLATEGLRVVGLARRPNLIDELSSQVQGSGSISSRKCDVSQPEDLASAFQWLEQEFGGVDVMVNNAGVFIPGHITDLRGEQITDAQLDCVLATNVRALMACSRRAVSSMSARSVPGHVININSVAGHYIPFSANFNVYPSSKYAVTAFTGALQAELAALGSPIRVTSICPGLVDTAMTEKARELQLPMLQPADVADTVVYALSAPPSVLISEMSIMSALERRL